MPKLKFPSQSSQAKVRKLKLPSSSSQAKVSISRVGVGTCLHLSLGWLAGCYLASCLVGWLAAWLVWHPSMFVSIARHLLKHSRTAFTQCVSLFASSSDSEYYNGFEQNVLWDNFLIPPALWAEWFRSKYLPTSPLGKGLPFPLPPSQAP